MNRIPLRIALLSVVVSLVILYLYGNVFYMIVAYCLISIMGKE